MRGLAMMGDQAMESLGTEARRGHDSDSRRRWEELLLRREDKELLLLRREDKEELYY